MHVSADTVRTHLRYTAWASRSVVEAASQLSDDELNRDFQTADKSVLGTLVHTFAADRVWLARIKGQVPARFLEVEADMKLSVIQNDWPALHEDWIAWSSTLGDSDLEQSLAYRDLKGNPCETPLWQIVLHVVNHGTHHRGMVSAMLRMMGRTPPAIDEIFYFRKMPV
jgi:uncharacterized damage-inducible protein DinB